MGSFIFFVTRNSEVCSACHTGVNQGQTRPGRGLSFKLLLNAQEATVGDKF